MEMTKLVRRMRVSLIVCFAILVVFYQAVRNAIAEVEREELVGEKIIEMGRDKVVGEKNTLDETVNSYEGIDRSSKVRNTGDNWVSWEIILKKMTNGNIRTILMWFLQQPTELFHRPSSSTTGKVELPFKSLFSHTTTLVTATNNPGCPSAVPRRCSSCSSSSLRRTSSGLSMSYIMI